MPAALIDPDPKLISFDVFGTLIRVQEASYEASPRGLWAV